MSGHHSHSHHHNNDKNIGISIALNLFITISEIIGGLISGSMSLLTDALHNFSDFLSLIISLIARKIARKEKSANYTFGFFRSEIFAALINSVSLIIIAFLLIIEAIKKFFEPSLIRSEIVIYLAAFSVFMNLLSVLLLRKEAKESMNIKSAYLHLFTDMLTSIVVLIGGIAMKFLHFYWLDSILSILIAVYLIFSSWSIFRDSVKILMEFSPAQIDIDKIIDEINKIDEVKNIHHIHIWQLDEKKIMFEAHLDMKYDISISEFDNIQRKIKKILANSKIFHYNLQPEWNIDDNKNQF